ncbi:MAG: hypothetical protein ACOCYU_02260 [Brevefilum sp.]
MENYWIQVYNNQRIGNLLEQDLVEFLLEANFDSLCSQYGVDEGLIVPALSQLELKGALEGVTPFYVLKYRSEDQSPLIINQWDTDEKVGTDLLGEALIHVNQPRLKDSLRDTWEILVLSLQPDQLVDFGLVLAYEVVRWAAYKGQGLVYGLDGVWYRMNRHQAFVPFEKPPQE